MGQLNDILQALKTIMEGMGIFNYVVGAIFIGLGFTAIGMVNRALHGR